MKAINSATIEPLFYCQGCNGEYTLNLRGVTEDFCYLCDPDWLNNLFRLKPDTASLIDHELRSIPDKYKHPFNSKHEGYAVLLEEVRELENEIFFGEKKAESKEEHKSRIRKEAIQVAAMAVRIIQEIR